MTAEYLSIVKDSGPGLILLLVMSWFQKVLLLQGTRILAINGFFRLADFFKIANGKMIMKKPNPILFGSLEFQPFTSERWNDFEKLFGEKGAYAGCWCMWWRISRSEFEKQQGEGNRRAMKKIVQAGEIPGIIAYRNGDPIGWCSVAPRERFHSLNRSPVLKRIDQVQVWSIVCFFISKKCRSRGMTLNLIKAAIDYVRRKGGKVIEAYPTDPRGRHLAPVSSFMGLPSVYKQAGFGECVRPSESKVIMRYQIR